MPKSKKSAAKRPRLHSVQWFIDFFSAIPDNKWTTATVENEYGQRCALGHCGVSGGTEPFSPAARALGTLFRKHIPQLATYSSHVAVYKVNDDLVNIGLRATKPRTRILNALKMIKKAGIP